MIHRQGDDSSSILKSCYKYKMPLGKSEVQALLSYSILNIQLLTGFISVGHF
jgi:hypothetical protein